MRESSLCFHNLEWPPDGARLAGPIAWLRGWIVGRPGHDFIDVRVRHAGGVHLGVLGLPRVDLAAHFGASRPWLPAEFILGVPVGDGAVELALEAMDAHLQWHPLQTLSLVIAADGTPPPRVEGRLEPRPDGSWTIRDAHHPFHGHLDQPGPTPTLRHGRAPVFGWLLDETRPLARVLATTDTLVFNHLEHSRTDEALAKKVSHPGARHARLRGAVDLPATLATPVSLRVYAVAPDETVHLCFAQRLAPQVGPVSDWPGPVEDRTYSETPTDFLPPFPHRDLPAFPSARPRRLLLILRSLQPNDAALRALDLARHLTGSHRWAARVVAMEDGPLRQDFEATLVETLVVDPAPLLAADDAAGLERALQRLERQIWWRHLDAAAVFDGVCAWTVSLAQRQGVPVIFDCGATEPLTPDPTAIPAVQTLLREGWAGAHAVCFGSVAAARAQRGHCAATPAQVVPAWFTPGTALASPDEKRRAVLAPLRTLDWLRRHHPAAAANWIFRQGPAGAIDDERLAREDDTWHALGLERAAGWSVADVALVLGPLFGRGPRRPLLDAAAAGIPFLLPRTVLTQEIFAGARHPWVDEANPLALAHAFLAWAALPASFQREADAFAPAFRARHDPARLIPEWERLLTSVAAAK